MFNVVKYQLEAIRKMEIWGPESLRIKKSMSYLDSSNLLLSITGNTDKNAPQITLWELGKRYRQDFPFFKILGKSETN